MQAEVLSVGTELLLGQTVNTDTTIVAKALSALGIDLLYAAVVGDNVGRLEKAVYDALDRSDILITTGGLGPTGDDLTKETVAAAAGKKLVLHEQSYQHLLDYFANGGMTENQMKQAMLPEGCTALKNDNGTAPGCAFRTDKGKIVIILDGEVQSAPAVQSEITGGQVSITGGYDKEAASSMETVLESGSLPVSFEYAQSQVVGPTLGQDALTSGVLVAAIGLALVMLYLLVFYQGLGLITAAAMAVFAVLYLGILGLLSHFGLFSLSMAGIAGVVLTIGMAADSSILTLERFREEIRMGRSVRAASVTGVRHGVLTSIDADLVTRGSARSLCFLASASVKGFGLTLAIFILCFSG